MLKPSELAARAVNRSEIRAGGARFPQWVGRSGDPSLRHRLSARNARSFAHRNGGADVHRQPSGAVSYPAQFQGEGWSNSARSDAHARPATTLATPGCCGAQDAPRDTRAATRCLCGLSRGPVSENPGRSRACIESAIGAATGPLLDCVWIDRTNEMREALEDRPRRAVRGNARLNRRRVEFVGLASS